MPTPLVCAPVSAGVAVGRLGLHLLWLGAGGQANGEQAQGKDMGPSLIELLKVGRRLRLAELRE